MRQRRCAEAVQTTDLSFPREELKLIIPSVLVHPKRRVGADQLLDAELLVGHAVHLRQPRVTVEVQRRHLRGGLGIQGSEEGGL
jgi:hypothetical protein